MIPPGDYGLVFVVKGGNWLGLRYFKSYEILPEFMKARKRGEKPIQIGEFVRVTFPNGETHDVHDYITKDQFIPAIDHIKRYPKQGEVNENNGRSV